MYRKINLFMALLFAVVCLTGVKVAADEEKSCWPSGRPELIANRIDNFMAGYKNFHKFCKKCHHRDNDIGAKFLTTESRTRKGWDRVFIKCYPDCAKDGTWDPLTKEDMGNLRDYLFTQADGLEDPQDEGKAYECERTGRFP